MAIGEPERRLDVMRTALRFWDPIGVIDDRNAGTGAADDEYDSYAVGLLRTLEGGAEGYRLAHHLAGIRHKSMTLGAEHPTERERDLAEKLVAWRERGFAGTPDFRFMRYAF